MASTWPKIWPVSCDGTKPFGTITNSTPVSAVMARSGRPWCGGGEGPLEADLVDREHAGEEALEEVVQRVVLDLALAAG